MSDYVRYYVDGLDEPRMLYAMHKCCHVHTVWMWMLCECGRTKRNQIERPSPAMLIGLGHKLNLPVGSLQLCLSLLVEIEYAEDDGKSYIVRNWNKMQSKYMQEKEWKETHKNQKKPKETENPIGEERRGEEIREDNPAYGLARKLAVSIASWKPDHIDVSAGRIGKTLTNWARDIDKAIRLDGRSAEAIGRLIEWLPKHQGSDGFTWKANVMSGAKLRKQFDALEIAMKPRAAPSGRAMYD